MGAYYRGRYTQVDEILKKLERLDVDDIEAMSNPNGEYVRFEEVRDMLYQAVDEALDRE